MKKIALEEHFVTTELAGYGPGSSALAQPAALANASRRLLDITEERLPEMDAHGLDIQVLSLNAPGIQAEVDASVAVSKAITVNDFLASVIREHPTRFRGFAALPLQDGAAAADELERAVTQLGFCGGLVNAHTNGIYLDDASLRVVWERAEALNVPLYLHPANGVDTAHVLSGHPELLGPIWSWGMDTATHALRLIFGGVFDDFPKAKLLLGHMGEGLPYVLWRLDSRWNFQNRHGIDLKLGTPSEYLRRHLYVTTSGVDSASPLQCALAELGADHVLFATDYPFESIGEACEFIDTVSLTDEVRAKVTHENAEALLSIN